MKKKKVSGISPRAERFTKWTAWARDLDSILYRLLRNDGLAREEPAAIIARAEKLTDELQALKERRRTIGPSQVTTSRPRAAHWTGHVDDVFSTNEAELLWPEVVAKFEARGSTPFGLNGRVFVIEPGPKHVVGSRIDCATIMGDRSESPGDALIRIVTDFYHMPIAKEARLYEVQFFWRSSGSLYARGTLRLPSPAEIMATRKELAQQKQPTGAESIA